MSITSNASTRSDMKQFMSRFRVQDNSLMSFSRLEREQIIGFQKFAAQKPDGTCSVCLRKLYPEERHYRKIEDVNSLNCFQWNVTPLTITERGVTKFMVCQDHFKTEESEFPVYIYPGKLKEIVKIKCSSLDKL